MELMIGSETLDVNQTQWVEERKTTSLRIHL